jgi:hypothetical protein
MAFLNTKTTFDVTPTLLGLSGMVDPNTPMVVSLDTPEQGVVENITLNADGSAGAFDATIGVIGTVTGTVEADSDLGKGKLSIVAAFAIEVVEPIIIGADALTVTERLA